MSTANVKKVYNALLTNGYQGIGNSFEQFNELLDRPENRAAVFSALGNEGFDGFGKDMEEFESLITPDRTGGGTLLSYPRAIGAGGVSSVETLLRSLRFGGDSEPLTLGIEGVNRIAESIRPDREYRNFVTTGLESAAQSLPYGVLGTAIGTPLGPAAPVIGATVTGGFFGAAEYDQFLEQVAKKARAEGATPEQVARMKKEAHDEAAVSAFAELGGEAVTGLIMGRALRPLFRAMPKDVAGRVVEKMGKDGLLPRVGGFLREWGKVAAQEVPSEAATAAVQAGQYRKAGVSDLSTIEAVKQVIAPTIVSSAVFAGVGSLSESIAHSAHDGNIQESEVSDGERTYRVLSFIDEERSPVNPADPLYSFAPGEVVFADGKSGVFEVEGLADDPSLVNIHNIHNDDDFYASDPRLLRRVEAGVMRSNKVITPDFFMERITKAKGIDEEQARASLAVLERMAAGKGITLTQWLSQNLVTIVNKGKQYIAVPKDTRWSDKAPETLYQDLGGEVGIAAMAEGKENPLFTYKSREIIEQQMPDHINSLDVVPFLRKRGIKDNDISLSGISDLLAENKGTIKKSKLLGWLDINGLGVDTYTHYDETSKEYIYESRYGKLVGDVVEPNLLSWVRASDNYYNDQPVSLIKEIQGGLEIGTSEQFSETWYKPPIQQAVQDAADRDMEFIMLDTKEHSPTVVSYFQKYMRGIGSDIEELTIDDRSVISARITDKVRATLDQPWSLFQTIGSSSAKGSTEFQRDGRAVINLAKAADVTTVMHEAWHVFARRSLNREQRQDFDSIFQGDEEIAARAFERYMAGGKREGMDRELNDTFTKFRKWVTGVYEVSTKNKNNRKVDPWEGTPLELDYTDKMESFFTELIKMDVLNSGDPIPMMFVDTNRVVRNVAEDERSVNKLKSVLKDWFSYTSYFNQIGTPLTGEAFRRANTIHVSQYELVYSIANKVGRLVKDNSELDVALTRTFEHDEDFAALPEDVQAELRPIRAELQTLFKNFEDSLKREGLLAESFQDRIVREIDEVLALHKDGLTNEEVEGFLEMRKEMSKQKFLPIPYTFWFEGGFQKNPAGALRVLRNVVAKKRKTLDIKELLDEGVIDRSDLKMSDILISYGTRVGKSRALNQIRVAAQREGLLIKKKNRNQTLPGSGERAELAGYQDAPHVAPMFRDYWVHPLLNKWLKESGVFLETRIPIRKAFSLFKMLQFVKPYIMPLNDEVQAIMRFGIKNTIAGKRLKYITEAYRHIRANSSELQMAQNFGLTSTPTPNQVWSIQNDRHAVMYHPLLRPFIHSDTVMGKLIKTTMGSTMNYSWTLAWELDKVSRMATYLQVREESGSSPFQAAREAALVHGDYADVPANTRHNLNMLLFTPTFKIAMARFYYQALKNGFSKTISNINGQPTNRSLVPDIKLHPLGVGFKMLFNAASVLLATDILMTALVGFERDEWGRKYYKDIYNEDSGKFEELVVTFNNPSTLWYKYALRVWQHSTGVDSELADLIHTFRFEVHPLIRVGIEVATNTGVGGDRISDPLVPGHRLRQFRYAALQLLPIVRETFAEYEGEPGAKHIREQYGLFLGEMLNVLSFAYLRKPEAQRVKGSINHMKGLVRQTFKEIDNTPEDMEAALSKILKAVNREIEKLED